MIDSTEAPAGLIVLRPQAALGPGGAEAFRREVVPSLAEGSRVVLDLSGVTRLDRSGGLAILDCARRVDPEGRGPGGVKLCGLSDEVRSVVELLRIHQVVDIFATRSEAVRAFVRA